MTKYKLIIKSQHHNGFEVVGKSLAELFLKSSSIQIHDDDHITIYEEQFDLESHMRTSYGVIVTNTLKELNILKTFHDQAHNQQLHSVHYHSMIWKEILSD